MTHTSVRRWLEEHTLVEPSLLDGAALHALVGERVAAFGGSESAYLEALSRSTDEADRLMACVAVPETCLFRYPRSFDLLLDHLQRLLATGVSTLRMLSVGCATGQEPYCMAMTALHAGWPADRIRVEALDRNSGFLRVAAAGRYGSSSIRTEVPAWAVPFLLRQGDAITIDPVVRALVSFSRADVTDPAALRANGPYNVVFCRNLLIYLNPQARTRLLDSICAELSEGGLLFVGHAEQVMRGGARLRAVMASHAFALELADERPTAATTELPPRASTHQPSPHQPSTHHGSPAQRSASAPLPPRTFTAPRPAPTPVPEDSLELARELADAGRTEDGETMIRAIMARRGPSAPAIELLGMIRISLNDTTGAKRLFEQAVYLDPTRSTSLLQLALLSERAGEARRADAYWERARRASSPVHQERKR